MERIDPTFIYSKWSRSYLLVLLIYLLASRINYGIDSDYNHIIIKYKYIIEPTECSIASTFASTASNSLRLKVDFFLRRK